MADENVQGWDASRYERNARFVSDLGWPVVELLAPQPGERVLDLGCGDGVLTAKIAELGCDVAGVDASAEMVEAARARGLDVERRSGDALEFESEFDAVFSNAALHWMKEPERVIDRVWRALRRGGRFVGEFGGEGNVSAIVAAVEAALATRGVATECPWYFPHPDEYARLLSARGFTVETIDLFRRPTTLPGDVGGWLETFASPYISALPPSERDGLIAEVVASLDSRLRDANGDWFADYVRLRFHATKPRG